MSKSSSFLARNLRRKRSKKDKISSPLLLPLPQLPRIDIVALLGRELTKTFPRVATILQTSVTTSP